MPKRKAAYWRADVLRAPTHFIMQPPFKDSDHISFFIRAESAALRNPMPFFQATAAAASGCMLRYKNRVTPERRLLAVIFRLSRRQAFCNKVPGMNDNRGQSLAMQINKILALEMEFAAESRL